MGRFTTNLERVDNVEVERYQPAQVDIVAVDNQLVEEDIPHGVVDNQLVVVDSLLEGEDSLLVADSSLEGEGRQFVVAHSLVVPRVGRHCHKRGELG